MPYCKNCGRSVDPSDRFCEACGASLKEPTVISSQAASKSHIPPPPPDQHPSSNNQNKQTLTPNIQESEPNQPPQENILGILSLKKSKSLGRYDSYTGVVTTHRLIFAQLTSQMLKDAAMQARDQAKAEGKGFFSQWGDQLKASSNYSQRYLTMNPIAIINETPGNFMVNNNTITEVKLNLKNIGDDDSNTEFEINVNSSQGRYQFRMDNRDANVKLLKQAYGERVKMPFGYFSSHGVRFKVGF